MIKKKLRKKQDMKKDAFHYFKCPFISARVNKVKRHLRKLAKLNHQCYTPPVTAELAFYSISTVFHSPADKPSCHKMPDGTRPHAKGL